MFPLRPAVVRRRPLLRAAVLGGGACLAGHAAATRSAQRAEREAVQGARRTDLAQTQRPQRQQPQRQPRDQQPRVPDSALCDRLAELVRMHDAGALTDAEFSAAKARVLG
jgi:hypothetical protein